MTTLGLYASTYQVLVYMSVQNLQKYNNVGSP